MNSAVKARDGFVEVEGLRIHYLEEGAGVPAILIHGASLGSSADVYRRNMAVLGGNGVRAIAVDLPGYGKSDQGADPASFSLGDLILAFMDALGLPKAAVIAHSFAGTPAVRLALLHPDRVSHLVVLGTGSLLPPLETAESGPAVGGREDAVLDRIEERMARQEPTVDDARALLESQLFHHELITEDELQTRHENSIGPAFQHFLARRAAAREGSGGSANRGAALWQRLTELSMPVLLIYGRQDRARAEDRAILLKQRYPQLNLHLLDECKHMVHWDAAERFHQLAISLLMQSDIRGG